MRKTAKDVREWLEAQPWYDAFKDNTKKRFWYDEITFSNILNGVFLSETIMAAFHWEYTPEGRDFWKEKHDEFMTFCMTRTPLY